MTRLSHGRFVCVLISIIYEFDGKTVFEGLKMGGVRPFIVPIAEGLDLVPATDLLETFSYWLYHDGRSIYPEHNAMHLRALQKSIESVRNIYDYIIIDIPPHIGEQTLNCYSRCIMSSD